MTPAPALAAENVWRAFAGKPVLRGASLALEPGRLTALLGSSGVGKSTLLRVLAGLERADAGTVRGPDGMVLTGPNIHVPPEARRVGVVFQDYALFPHLTVAQNIGFGLDRLTKPAREARVDALLAAAALAGRGAAYPHELSGGEQQRVALIRALAPQPLAMLLDEPFSNLDGELRRAVRERALDLLRTTSAAVLLVTHDVEEALSTADVVALMDEGRVIQTGAPEAVYLDPVSSAAARLTGEVNIWRGRPRGGRLETPFGAVAAARALEGVPSAALVRPEAIALLASGAGQGLPSARVVARRASGAQARLSLQAGETVWRARAPLWTAPEPGDLVGVRIEPRLARVAAEDQAATSAGLPEP